MIVDLLWLSRYDYEPGWRVLPHTHRFFQMICVIGGTLRTELEGDLIDVVENGVIVIAPGQEHAFQVTSGDRVRTLDTKFLVTQRDLSARLQEVPVPFLDADRRVQTGLERIKVEGMQRARWYRDVSNAIMTQVLVGVCREHALCAGDAPADGDGADGDLADREEIETVGAPPQIKRALAFVADHYQESISVHDMCGHAGMSSSHLARHFRETVGVTPQRYLKKYRIERAKELLLHTDVAIKEIADRTGFKTIHHFTRSFTEVTHQSPGAWRDLERCAIWKNITFTSREVDRGVIVTSEESSINPAIHPAMHASVAP